MYNFPMGSFSFFPWLSVVRELHCSDLGLIFIRLNGCYSLTAKFLLCNHYSLLKIDICLGLAVLVRLSGQ